MGTGPTRPANISKWTSLIGNTSLEAFRSFVTYGQFEIDRGRVRFSGSSIVQTDAGSGLAPPFRAGNSDILTSLGATFSYMGGEFSKLSGPQLKISFFPVLRPRPNSAQRNMEDAMAALAEGAKKK